MADAFLISHHYEEATNQSRKTINMDSRFALGHYELGQALAQRHLFKEAVDESQDSHHAIPRQHACTSNLANAYAVSGRRKEAMEVLDRLKNGSNGHSATPSEIALHLCQPWRKG